MDVLGRAGRFFSRVRSGSVRRMWHLASDIHDESGYNTLVTFLDMGYCIFRYGLGYQEYRGYHFEGKPRELRSTFMTMNHNVALTNLLCDSSCYHLVSNKIDFLRTYADFVGRDWVDLRTCTDEELDAFLADHPTFFAKPDDSFGGQGVERMTVGADEGGAELRARLSSEGHTLLEEPIRQHEDMNRLNASTVNTLRMVTVVLDGKPQLVYTIVRMGVGDACVDNATSGGIYTWVDEDGVLRYPCFSDKTGFVYDTHPTNGLVFSGFEIPLYEEAKALALRAAMVEPRLGYLGWDVAITPDGPILVEGNTVPGYDMPQNSAWHPDGRGMLPTFEKVLGGPVPK